MLDAKGVAKGRTVLVRKNSGHPTLVLSSTTSIQYRVPPADGGYGPVRSTKTRCSGLPDFTLVSLGTVRLIVFALHQPSPDRATTLACAFMEADLRVVTQNRQR